MNKPKKLPLNTANLGFLISYLLEHEKHAHAQELVCNIFEMSQGYVVGEWLIDGDEWMLCHTKEWTHILHDCMHVTSPALRQRNSPGLF